MASYPRSTHSARSRHNSPERKRMKRIVVCCDGTWMNSLGKGSNKPPSNVTRISRVIKRQCLNETPQVILYHPGLGSSGSKIDQFTGGVFGMGLDRDIRLTYSFVCNNHADGDEIILIGFSRGAFTARSVADMIASIGLLNTEGLDHFYDVFEDYENLGNKHRSPDEYLFPDLTPLDSASGKELLQKIDQRKREYRRWLSETMNWTRPHVTIKALGVWDTVGTLGIPPAPLLGIRGSAKQWTFSSTQISDKVENAFQALALDEPRFAFRPALWERVGRSRTNLKQVWFPGNHGGVGGGWYDQQIADLSLAWMCDQLSYYAGVEFNLDRMKDTFLKSLRYSAAHPYPFVPGSLFKPAPTTVLPWAVRPICRGVRPDDKFDAADCPGTDRHPRLRKGGRLDPLWDVARAWGLGQTRYPTKRVQTLLGKTVRHPGLFTRTDTETNRPTDEPLAATGERIHSSVRVRLACRGLGLDDRDEWACDALTRDDAGGGGPLWKLQNRPGGLPEEEEAALRSFQPNELRYWGREYGREPLYAPMQGDGQWRWVFRGDGDLRPYETVLPEEPLVGYWERLLLGMRVGRVDVWRWAEDHPPLWLMTRASKRH